MNDAIRATVIVIIMSKRKEKGKNAKRFVNLPLSSMWLVSFQLCFCGVWACWDQLCFSFRCSESKLIGKVNTNQHKITVNKLFQKRIVLFCVNRPLQCASGLGRQEDHKRRVLRLFLLQPSLGTLAWKIEPPLVMERSTSQQQTVVTG